MERHSRRDFLRAGGLAAVGTAGGALVLRAGAGPTPASQTPAIAEQVLANFGEPPETLTMKDGARPTRRNALGPFHVEGAPFRGKASGPHEPGTVLVVTGRVWAYDTRKPLSGAVIDIWHVDAEGNYSPADGSLRNRLRIITSETGAYEYETIHPVVYQMGRDLRAPHIHYRVASPGYKTLITQLFFEGDPKQDEDTLFDASLMVPVTKAAAHGKEYHGAVFDLVMEKAR